MTRYRWMILVVGLLILLGMVINPASTLATHGDPIRTESEGVVAPEVWQALAAGNHQGSYLVRMFQAPQTATDSTVDAQIRLEPILDSLKSVQSIQDYQVFYGSNIIRVTGSVGSVRFLSDWPEVARIEIDDRTLPDLIDHQQTGILQEPAATGQISGRITAPNGTTGLTGIMTTAYRQTGPVSWEVAGTATTNSNGDYVVSNLAAGVYRLRFEDPAGSYVTEYWDDKFSFGTANPFDLANGQVLTGKNASLALAGKISGTVTTVQGGAAIVDIVVSAWRLDGSSWVLINSAVSASNGTFTISSLPGGTYRVRYADVYDPPRYLTEWWNNQINLESANNISVTAGVTTPNISASLGGYGWIEGNVKATDGVTNLAGVDVEVYEWISDYWNLASYATTDSAGNYKANGLVTKSYRVLFTDPYNQFATEYYNDKSTIETANDVAASLGVGTTGINAQLALKSDTLSRSLVTGWNLISLPVTLSNTTPVSAFGSLVGKYGDVYAYNACDTGDPWKLFNPSLPGHLNDLTAVSVTQGYWINLTSAGTLTLTGTHPLQTTINLCAGWNLVGFPSVTKQPVATALQSIAGKYTLVYQYKASDTADPWKSYNPSAPPQVNDLKEMEAGFGYWIRMTQAATLTINGR